MRIAYILFLMLSTFALSSQTVGTILNTDKADNGYYLMSPNFSRTTYLIDNCGNKINEWHSDYIAGMISYLSDEGKLYRAGRKSSSVFPGAGLGGVLQIFSWEGQLEWEYQIANDSLHLHHDFKILPNGNILSIAWEYYSQEQALDLGRKPDKLGDDGFWSEQILEIMPVGSSDAQIVWQWKAIDHYVQNIDDGKPNFGVLSNPDKIDINFDELNGLNLADWLHFNSIDYNADRDHILIGSRSLSEIFIIDHSTTTAEATGGVGGDSGMGGKLLYRWGNPQNYLGENFTEKRILFGQHDANWIEDGLEGAGNILLFNNGINKASEFSSVIELEVPYFSQSGYNFNGNEMDQVEDIKYNATILDDARYYSSKMSGARRLQNGNTLVTLADDGRIFQFGSGNGSVWEYINPVDIMNPIKQGEEPVLNQVFKMIPYSPNFKGFANRNLMIGDKIEIEPIDQCELFDLVSLKNNNFLDKAIEYKQYGGQFIFNLEYETLVSWYNSSGQMIKSNSHPKGINEINVEEFPTGIYFLHLRNLVGNRFISDKVFIP